MKDGVQRSEQLLFDSIVASMQSPFSFSCFPLLEQVLRADDRIFVTKARFARESGSFEESPCQKTVPTAAQTPQQINS